MSVAALKAALPARYKQAARRTLLRIARLTAMGSRVACPVCGGSFGHFARFHGERDQCPRCGSLMRHRALVLLLDDRLDLHAQQSRVLHVGPAKAVAERFESRNGIEYVSFDLQSPIAKVHGDVMDMPFPDESFDVVLCIHVLEHVADDRQALREMHRVLRPGGRAIFQVPPSNRAETIEDPLLTDPADRERLFGQYDHVRLCGDDYPARIREAGFDVTREDYVATLEPSAREKYGLRVGEPFDLCIRT